jgi:hypothetical protein
VGPRAGLDAMSKGGLFRIEEHNYTVRLIQVAARSESRIIFDHSITGIVGSNPARGMDVYVSFFLCYTALCR